MRTLLVTFGLILCTMVVLAVDQRKPQMHTVTIEGMRFQPEMLTVERGDTIVWVNKDLVPHTATSKAGELRFQVDSDRQVLEIHRPKKR